MPGSGFELHPAIAATGAPHGMEAPAEVRPGGPEDLPLTEAVDRAVRGAAHGADVLTMLAGGHELLVAPERGYAVLRGRQVRLLAAFDDDGARTVLRGGPGPDRRARRERPRRVHHRPPAVGGRRVRRGAAGAAGRLRCVFTGGDVGPFSPYLPSGAYL